MTTDPPCAAWILAGGRSSRFGSDKAEHLVDGEPLLLRTARVCREAGLEPHAVARSPRPGLDTVLDAPTADRHPLHGVAAALAAARARGHRHALVLPVDLPELRAEQLRALLATPAPAVAVGQPLLAHLPVGLAERAAEAAARGEPVRRFIAGLDAHPVELGPLLNLNRPPPP